MRRNTARESVHVSDVLLATFEEMLSTDALAPRWREHGGTGLDIDSAPGKCHSCIGRQLPTYHLDVFRRSQTE